MQLIVCTRVSTPVLDYRNAAPIYQQWYDLRHKWWHLHPVHTEMPDPLTLRVSYTPEQLAQVQESIEGDPDAVSLLHQATAAPYLVVHAGKYAFSAQVREAAREIKSESYLLAHRGSYSRAVSVQASCLNIARQCAGSSTLIGYWTGSAIETMSLKGFQEILSMAGPNQAVDDQVEDTLRKNLPVLSLRHFLIGGICEYVATFDTARGHLPEFISDNVQGHGTQPASKWEEITPDQSRFLSNLADAAEARYLQQHIVLIDAVDMPAAARASVFSGIDTQNGIAQDGMLSGKDIVCTLSGGIIITDAKNDRDEKLLRATEQVTLAAAALLSMRAKSGVFPGSLPGMFIDPFNGKLLGYTVNGETGFVVYSVGQTGTYDGKMPNNNEADYRYPASAPVPVPQTTRNLPTPRVSHVLY